MRRAAIILAVAALASPAMAAPSTTTAPAPTTAGANATTTQQSAANYAAQLRDSKAASAVVGSATIQIGSIAPESCSLPASGAWGSIESAFTLIIPWSDRGCARRREFWDLLAANKPMPAVQVLCEIPDVRLAMARAHDPCELQVVDAPKAPSS